MVRKTVTDLNGNINSFAFIGAALESIKQSKEIRVQEFLILSSGSLRIVKRSD
jgi:hypothetical protein